MFYVYIIKSEKLGVKYTGFTSNLKRRILEHKNHGDNFTSKADDWMLIYYQAFLNKSDALREEKFLKTGKGKERIKYLLSGN